MKICIIETRKKLNFWTFFQRLVVCRGLVMLGINFSFFTQKIIICCLIYICRQNIGVRCRHTILFPRLTKFIEQISVIALYQMVVTRLSIFFQFKIIISCNFTSACICILRMETLVVQTYSILIIPINKMLLINKSGNQFVDTLLIKIGIFK